MESPLQIFISSTMDLKKERKAVTEVINQIKATPIKMEFFEARNDSPEQVCLKELSKSQIYIGIFAYKYGYVPLENNPKNLSVTVMEYEKAKELGIPTLVFIKDCPNRDHSLSVFLKEISNFSRGIYRKTFVNIKDLKYWLLASLVNYLLRKNEDGQKDKIELLSPIESKYRKYLIKTCEYVDFKGIYQLRKVVQIRLSDLYVPIKLSKSSTISDNILDIPSSENSNLRNQWAYYRRENFINNIIRHLDSIDDQNKNQLYLDKNLNVEEVISSGKKMVILGGPGSGKTTILRHLAGKLISDEGSTLFPILVPLREYSRFKKVTENISLISFLTKYFISHDLNIPEDFFTKNLSSGGCIVMFDGMDEILNEQDRIGVAAQIEQFAACFGEGNTVIVTSRIPSYRLSQLTGFEHYTIQQLSGKQISKFTKKWFGLVKEKFGSENRQELLSMLLGDPELLILSTNPLLLSIICLIGLQGIPIPKRKADLYDICIRTLSSSWESKKGFEGFLNEPQGFDIIKKVAFSFLEGKKNTATEYEIISSLNDLSFFEQLSKCKTQNSYHSILRTIAERSGLLIEREPNTYGFIHGGFRDYLAALYLAGMDNVKDMFVTYLAKRLHNLDYEQTICLCSRCLAMQSSSRASIFIDEMLNASTLYEDKVHCDLVLSAKCLFHSGISQGSQAKAILDKIICVLKKGNYYESQLVIPTLIEADNEIQENVIGKLIWELDPGISMHLIELLVLQRTIPENSGLIDSILSYIQSQLNNIKFDYEISFIVSQLAKKGSHKAIDLAINVIKAAKYDVAYALSFLMIYSVSRNEYFRQKILNVNCKDTFLMRIILTTLYLFDRELGRAKVDSIVKEKVYDSTFIENAKQIFKSKKIRKEKNLIQMERKHQATLKKLLNTNNNVKITTKELNELITAKIPEKKLIDSLASLKNIFRSNRFFAYKLCQLYASNLKQYPSLAREISDLTITFEKENSLYSKKILSYLAIDLDLLEVRKQKQLLLELVEDGTESKITRQAAISRLDKLELDDKELARLFSLSSVKIIQKNIFKLLLNHPNFNRAIVTKAIAEEIDGGNSALLQTLNIGIRLGYG